MDLFSGCGGISLGFSNAGYKCLAAVEYWKPACETYRHNFPDHPLIEGDITKQGTRQKLYKIVGKRQVDVLCGGFPCGSFSVAGLRNPGDPRSKLYKEIIKIAAKLKPKILCLENVPGLLSMEKGGVVKQIVTDIEKLGYKVDYKVLNASDFGVAQNRKRVIFLANRINICNKFPV